MKFNYLNIVILSGLAKYVCGKVINWEETISESSVNQNIIPTTSIKSISTSTMEIISTPTDNLSLTNICKSVEITETERESEYITSIINTANNEMTTDKIYRITDISYNTYITTSCINEPPSTTIINSKLDINTSSSNSNLKSTTKTLIFTYSGGKNGFLKKIVTVPIKAKEVIGTCETIKKSGTKVIPSFSNNTPIMKTKREEEEEEEEIVEDENTIDYFVNDGNVYCDDEECFKEYNKLEFERLGYYYYCKVLTNAGSKTDYRSPFMYTIKSLCKPTTTQEVNISVPPNLIKYTSIINTGIDNKTTLTDRKIYKNSYTNKKMIIH